MTTLHYPNPSDWLISRVRRSIRPPSATYALVVELADTADSKPAAFGHLGSTPGKRTNFVVDFGP